MRRTLNTLLWIGAGACVLLGIWHLWLVAAGMASSSAREEPGKTVSATSTVVSAGICADQTVIPLVQRDRILGVSAQAADASISPVADQAIGLPVVQTSAEDLLLTGSDIVVLNTYGDGKTAALLRRLSVTVLRPPYDAHIDDIPASLTRFGKAIGAEPAAGALADRFVRTLSQLQAAADQRGQTDMLAAYYRPDGGSAGQDTYVADAMSIAGYRSLASTLGQAGWGRLDLEQVLLHPPQVMMLSFFQRAKPGLRSAFGHHPVFRHLMETRPIISIPGRLWGCGGWPTMLATAKMVEDHP